MESVKNRVRNKFECFKPTAVEDDWIKPEAADGGSINTAITSIFHHQGKKRTMCPKILTSLSERKVKVSSEGGDAGGGRSNKERSRRSFCRVLKTVSCVDTSMTKKKLRNTKTQQTLNPLRRNITLKKSHKDSDLFNGHEKPSIRESPATGNSKTSNDCWSSSLVSSSFSTISSTNSLSSLRASSLNLKSKPPLQHKESVSVESKQLDHGLTSMDKVREDYYNVDIRLCSFLICLLVLIIWGKLCAILCTSTLFLLFSGGVKRVDSPGNCIIELPEKGSEKHKKRVIMEGLLGRNHSRVL